MTQHIESKFSIAERREIYLRAAEIALAEDKAVPDMHVFMCNAVDEAIDALGHPCIAWNKTLTIAVPELFLFCEDMLHPTHAWMSEQLKNAGVKDTAEVNKCKHIALLLCAEMCTE